MNLNIGDMVFIKGIGWVTVMSVHVNQDMYDYTGTDDEGVCIYFDEDEYE